jgi:hypothetical protein
MSKNSLMIAALLALLPAAPAIAWPTTHDRSSCPQERARAAAAAKATAATLAWKKVTPAPTTVVVKGSGGLATWGQFTSDLMP